MLRGQILLWSGSIVSIPDGWALCDGTNGTPDLTDRFVVGAGDTFDPDDTGGNINHNHTFTATTHGHVLLGPPGHGAGAQIAPQETNNVSVVGTTDNEDGRPPYYALAYIMKLLDDPVARLELPWPYAAKAIIEHAVVDGDLIIYLTFRHKMNIDNKPANALWLCDLDGVGDLPDASAWLDHWTMQLTITGIADLPDTLTVEYDGPDPLLATTWNKQWEPWGPIISFGPSGTPYGSFFGNEIGWVEQLTQFNWFTITDADITAGEEFLTTFQNNKEIKIERGGTYSLEYYISLEISIANKHVLTAFEINGAEQSMGLNHHEFGRANEEAGISASAIFTLAANDLISLAVATEDAGGPIATVQHVGLTLHRINP